ncbi:hypothetical protein PybrP1_004174 [[Pythium] brassicae (nom. inval.)]|nr:hypothetical protein PybrP1_004174 [[Pythium] brassicae (nom. inval.)]
MGGGGRDRAAFAYHDLDEETVFPLDDHEYHSQTSPTLIKKPLSESVILRSHFDKSRSKRRRIALVAGGLLLLLGGLAFALLAKSLDAQRSRSPLEMTIGAPYGALRGKGDLKQSRSTPSAEDLGSLRESVPGGVSVGDFDPSDSSAEQSDSEDYEYLPDAYR